MYLYTHTIGSDIDCSVAIVLPISNWCNTVGLNDFNSHMLIIDKHMKH